MSLKSSGEKSTKTAILLSGIFPGVGHFYGEDWAKGAGFFVASMVFDAFLLPEGYWNIIQDIFRDINRGEVPLNLQIYVRLLSLILFRIWAIVDAERSVRRKNTETAKAVLKTN